MVRCGAAPGPVSCSRLTCRPGDVVHLEIFGKHMIILNTFEAAQDLMEKRSAIYSDRPRFVMLAELSVMACLWFSHGANRMP